MIPEYYIKGRGDVYCFQPSSKTYVKILRNQKVYVLDEKKDFINRILIYTNCGRIVEIDYDELEYLGHKNTHHLKNLSDLNNILEELVQPRDMVITMGAGDIWRYSDKYNEHLKEKFSE